MPAPGRTTSSGRPILTQLAGLRAAASFWILLRHFLGAPRAPGAWLIERACVPTGSFILLSGFVTHYAYMGKRYETQTQVLRYYARRFGAILFSYYASTMLMLLFSILACRAHSCIGGTAAIGPAHAAVKTALTFLMLQSFEPLMPSYPNGPAWTISTMGLLWLLYPKLQAWLRRPLQARPFALAAGAAIACQLPMVLAFFAGCVAPGLGKPYFVSEAASLVGYHFPPLRLADFVLGMALAQALADGRAAPERRAWAWLADGAAFAVWAVCACVPWDARSEPFPTSGYEPLFIGGMQPLIGLFIFASSCPGGELSAWGAIFRHPVLQGLGEYSFQVYLWHWPIGLIFKGVEIAVAGNTGQGMAGSFFISYILTTYVASAAVSGYAEEPFRKWLRARIDAWAARQDALAAAASKGDECVAGEGSAGGAGAARVQEGGVELAGGAPPGDGALALEEGTGAGAAALLDPAAARSDSQAVGDVRTVQL